MPNILGELPLRDAVLVGWSLGGMLLLEALSRLTGPSPRGAGPGGDGPSFTRRPDYPWGQPPAVVRAMRRALTEHPHGCWLSLPNSVWLPARQRLSQARAGRLLPQAAPGTLAAGLDYLLNRDLRPLLSRPARRHSRHPGAGGSGCAPGPGRVPSGTASRGPAESLARRRASALLDPAAAFNRILDQCLNTMKGCKD